MRGKEDEEEDAKSRERRGEGGNRGAPCLARVASSDEELTDRQRAAERDKRDRDDVEERGGRSPRDARKFGSRGARGGNDDACFRNLFIVENITLIC